MIWKLKVVEPPLALKVMVGVLDAIVIVALAVVPVTLS